MRHQVTWLLPLFVAATLAMAGCANEPATEAPEPSTDSHEGHDHADGEHDHDGDSQSPSGSESREETDEHSSAKEVPKKSGLGQEDRYSETHRFARISLAYDSATSSFKGQVENMSRDVMEEVHVTIRLSDGQEIGPQTVRDIEPGSSGPLELAAESTDFESWTVVPVVGPADGSGVVESGDFGDIGDIEDPNQ